MSSPRQTIVRGTRVALTSQTPDDARLHYEIWLDPRVQRNFNTPLPWPTFEAYTHWRASRHQPRFAATIVTVPEGRPVGVVSLSPDAGEPDLAIVLEADVRGRGLGTEAMRLASNHVMQVLGLPYVVAGAYEGNDASIRMLEKAGFVRVPAEDRVEDDAFRAGSVRQLAFRCARGR